jgi:phenylpropionate dioxygenase-like ring-hydroxylating dioxygenase large terminal subunit
MDEIEQRMLRRTWFPVARLEDVQAGVVAGNILGTELVIYRAGGRTTVAQGRCPHRGMALWLGQLRDGCLECPYHGWLFEPGDGRCSHIPALPAGSKVSGIALRTYPVREAYGHVWSCLEDPYLPFPGLIGYGKADWQYGYGVPADLACGMRQLTENFRDMAHFPFVHTGTMGPNVRHEVDPYEIWRSGWDLEWALTTELGGTALDGNQALANRQTLTYRITLPMAAYVRTSFPDGAGRFVAQFATPINAEGTRVRQFWIVGIDATVSAEHGVSLEEMWEYERKIFEEDYPIVENQWPAEAPLDVHGQVHARSDKYSIVFRRLYTELLAEFELSDSSFPESISADGPVKTT